MDCKLGHIFEFIRNGVNIKQGLEGGYPITRIETISNGFIDRNKMGYAGITDPEKYSDYLLQDGDILMSHINSEKHLGKTAIYEGDDVIIHGMNLLCLRPKKKKAYPRYVYYYLNHFDFKKQIPKITKKSVNQASFSVSDLKKLKIYCPSIDQQKQIADVLDKAQELIDKRKAQIEALDQLIESVFLEMFGDPIKNSSDYCLLPVEKLCTHILGGGTPSKRKPEFYRGDIPWVTPKDMKSILTHDSRDHINENAIANSSAKRIPPHSLLMVIRSGILKKKLPLSINMREVTVNQDMKAFIVDKKKVTVEYLLYFFHFYQRVLLNRVRSVTADNLDFKQIKKTLVPVPSIKQQEKFTALFYKIIKEKEKNQLQLVQLENNFQSLMQRAFRGELFSNHSVQPEQTTEGSTCYPISAS